MHGENTSLKSLPTAVSPLELSEPGDEANQVAAIFREILRELPYYNERAKAGELSKYTSTKLRCSVLSDPEAVLLAKVEGQLAGFLFNHLDDETVWLSWFGVLSTYRNQGVGSALLRALDLRAINAGAHKIWCDSRTSNELSKSILVRHGYMQLCTLRDHWYRQDFILWERRVG